MKSLVEKSRNRFNVTVAEVADQDVYQKASIGVAVIGNDGRVLNSLLDWIIILWIARPGRYWSAVK